jgi:hypothetical protein
MIDDSFSVITPYKISSKSTNQFKRYQGVYLHLPQKFKRPPLWNGCRYGIRKYGMEVNLNKISSNSTNQFKRCTHLRNLSVYRFGTIYVTLNVITSIQQFIQMHKSVENLHPPQKFERPPFWNG